MRQCKYSNNIIEQKSVENDKIPLSPNIYLITAHNHRRYSQKRLAR